MSKGVDICSIPKASDIDYSDTSEVCGYQLLLCKMFEKAGGFSYPSVSNATIREVRNEGRIWLNNVKTVVNHILEPPQTQSSNALTLDAIPDLLSSYDFFYRVCNGSAGFGFIRDARLKTVDRWLKGDKSITQTDVVLLILSEADRDIRTLDNRYSRYGCSIMEAWIDELCRYGRFRDITMSEAYGRLSYLLKSDLTAYLGSKEQDKIKARWVDTYKLDDLTLLDTPALWKYIAFVRTASFRGYLPCADSDVQHVSLYSELASRPDLQPYSKEAINLDLAMRSFA